MPQSDDEGFLARWSRRKRATADGKVVPAEPAIAPATATATAVDDPAGQGPAATTAAEDPGRQQGQRQPSARDDGQGRGALKRVLTEADFADVDFAALDFRSDYSRFMQPGVPDAIRNKALRQLWASDPIMANMDGLHDYWEDYTDAAVAVPAGTLKTAYRIGKGFLSDDEVAQWDALGKPAAVPPVATTAAAAPEPEAAAEATTEVREPDGASVPDVAAAVEPEGESRDPGGEEASSSNPSTHDPGLTSTPRDVTG